MLKVLIEPLAPVNLDRGLVKICRSTVLCQQIATKNMGKATAAPGQRDMNLAGRPTRLRVNNRY
jgi:hypothetical protein